jgi:hypothetical protein
MGRLKYDWEKRIAEQADRLAKEHYQSEFGGLPARLQMQVWLEAEHQVTEEMKEEICQ